jgi:6-phosphofructokinase 1
VGATLTVIPEEFSGTVHLQSVCDILEGAILKRQVLGRTDGVALIAEGVLEKTPQDELTKIEGVRIMHDAYGHLRLAELDLAYLLKTMVEHRFAERGVPMGIVHKTIGYEVRCAPPIAFDCEYVRVLGYGAVEFLLNPPPEQADLNGVLVCLEEGKIRYLKFDELMNPQTGKTQVRLVDISKPSYKVAREYMIRLEREDFENEERLKALAQSRSAQANPCTPDDFRAKFHYLVTDLRGAI